MALHPSGYFYDDQTLTLEKNGTWRINGQPILHEKTVRVLFRSIKKYESAYWIELGKERKQIDVEDTAYFVTRLSGDATQGFQVHLSDETEEPLSPETLSIKETDSRLTCRVKKKSEEARFLFQPYHQLLENLDEKNGFYVLSLQGRQYPHLKK